MPIRFAIPYGRALLMGSNGEKPVRVSDPLTRALLGVFVSFATLFGTWFASQVQRNAVETGVLTQRVNTMESTFPKQIQDLKADMRNEFNDVKDMIRRLPIK